MVSERVDPMGDGDGSVEVPIFYGDEDPEKWISWLEEYFTDHGFTEETKISFAYGFMEDDAQLWFEDSQAEFTSWSEIKTGLLQRFSKGKESTVIASSQSKMSKWSSYLDSLEKYLLETEERIETKTLSDEEKEKTAFGVDSTVRDESSQQGEKNLKDVEMAKDARQVFDNMLLGGKRKTLKRKKRKFTRPKRWKYKSGKRNFSGNALTKKIHEKMKLRFPKGLEGQHRHKEQAAEPNNAYQVFEKSFRGENRARKKMKRGKSKRCKFKQGNKDQLKFQFHMKRDFKIQSMRRMKGCKSVICCCVVLDKLLLWKIKVKKMKSQSGNQLDCYQVLDNRLLSRSQVGTRKNTFSKKWKKGIKFKEKVESKSKRAQLHSPLKRGLSDQLKGKDKIIYIKSNTFKYKHRILHMEKLLQIITTIKHMLIIGVEAAKEKSFRTGRMRHKFRHKHKKKVMMFLTIHTKSAFVEQNFRVNKGTWLKIERKLTKPNSGVYALICVKLIWGLMAVDKK